MAPIARKEQRRFPRIKLSTPIRYQIMGMPGFTNTLSEDISVGGIGFINDRFIAPSNKVLLEIAVMSRVLNPIGRITWVVPLAHSDRYHLGVEFLEFEPGEQIYLSDYINMQTGQT